MPWTVEPSDVELFDAERRRAIVEHLFALREWWTLRGGFHTLGCACYLDGNSRAALDERVPPSNELLLDYFGPSLEDVRSFVASAVGVEASWRADLPLPGFHIFGADALAVGQTTLTPHFDMQFYAAGYGYIDSDGVLSLTIPVLMPEGGASLDYWPIDFDGFNELRTRGAVSTVDEVQRLYPMCQVWYEDGRPCMQRGLPLHRIGPSRSVRPDDYRITLQCHAVRDGDRWIVYW